MKELGTLRVVSVRDVWALEPQHFSTWLAENIEQLGHAIGIELAVRGREVGVGAFSLDMLAHDVDRDRIVIIENQLGRTDHDHLGKLLTYAAGTKAEVIVWIAPEFREEHRAAIDWLNNNTDQSKEFFAIEPVPDETTICKFRHLLERHRLGPAMLREVNAHLASAGMKVASGTIVDATIIHAPSSTKNSRGKRNPEMHQTRKGNEWHFGMKAHIGVDSKTRIVHSFVATPANVHDSRVIGDLLHGSETRVWGDSGYRGKTDAIRAKAPCAQDFTQRHSSRAKGLGARERAANRTKSRVRARVEHVFHVVKRIFGFVKVRYRGLAKNGHRLIVNFALANLYLTRRRLLQRA